MTQEEKQLLLKDLSARLPYGVKAQVQGWDEAKEEEVNIPLKIYSINTDGYVYFESNDYDVTYCSIDACRLYLRPMYSMTEEEKKEFQACHCVYGWHPDFQPTMCNLANECNMFDWLIAHHFDFRGLISKGLALEAYEDIYKED